MRLTLALFLALASWPFATQGLDERRHRAECQMWSKLENETLNLQDEGHANCTTNEDCTGFSCVGKYREKDLSFGFKVLPCSNPPGVQIFGYAPQINAKQFSHVFTHEDQYEIPGVLLNQGLGNLGLDTDLMTGKLEVHIQKNDDGHSLMLGLVAMACIKDTKDCPLKKPVFNHTKIPVPECTPEMAAAIKADSPCSIGNLRGCGSNQMCVQGNDGGANGVCDCLPGFIKHTDLTCITKENDESLHPVPSSPKSATTKSQPHVSDSDADGGASATSAVVAVVVSALVLLVIVGAAAFVIFRTRLAPRLRARLTRTPYEGVIIGQNGRAESQQNVVTA